MYGQDMEDSIITLVEMAWNQSAEMYGNVKKAHEIFQLEAVYSRGSCTKGH